MYYFAVAVAQMLSANISRAPIHTYIQMHVYEDEQCRKCEGNISRIHAYIFGDFVVMLTCCIVLVSLFSVVLLSLPRSLMFPTNIESICLIGGTVLPLLPINCPWRCRGKYTFGTCRNIKCEQELF